MGLVGTRLRLRAAPPIQEATTVYAVGSDTSVFLARLSRSDAGFLTDQLTTRVAFIEQGGATVQHRAQYGAAERDPDGSIRAGPDHLRHSARGWTLRVAGTGVQATAEQRDQVDTCPPVGGSLNGGLGLTPADAVSPSGQMTSSGGTALRGTALVVPSRTRDDQPGDALYVFSPTFSAGLDPDAPCPAWVRAGTETWTGPPDTATPALGVVQLGPWELTLKAAGPAVAFDTAHLHPAERFIAGLVGFRPAVQDVRRVSVRVRGPGVSGPRTGILLTTR